MRLSSETPFLTDNLHHRVKLTTGPASLELLGTCFCADPILNVIILQTMDQGDSNNTGSNHASSYHIVPVSKIESLQILSLPERPRAETKPTAFDTALPPIARVDIREVMRRGDNALQKTRKRDAEKGKGVTREAQEIFDELNNL